MKSWVNAGANKRGLEENTEKLPTTSSGTLKSNGIAMLPLGLIAMIKEIHVF